MQPAKSKQLTGKQKNVFAITTFILLAIITLNVYFSNKQSSKVLSQAEQFKINLSPILQQSNLNKTIVDDYSSLDGIESPELPENMDDQLRKDKEKEREAFYKTIQPPLKNISTQVVKENISASIGGVINHPSGSQIIIPAKAFVDKNGREVEGNVSVAYREYRDAWDFFVSGIPMSYTESGNKFQFESAGMMNLTASINNEPVYVNSQSKIKVNMISDFESDDFNLYYFDNAKGKWIVKGKDEIISKIAKPEGKSKAAKPKFRTYKPERNILPVQLTAIDTSQVTGWFIFKKKKEKEIVFKFIHHYKSYQEFTSFRSVKWKYAGNNVDSIGNLLFRDMYNTSERSSEIAYAHWNDVRLYYRNGDEFMRMTLYSDADSLSINVVPLFNSNRAEKELENKYAVYQLKLTKRIEHEHQGYLTYKNDSINFERKLIEAANAPAGQTAYVPTVEQQVYRSFLVDNFGTWNCDRPYPVKHPVTVAALFADMDNKPLQLKSVYLVDKNINSILSFYSADFDKFSFNPRSQNLIWGVLPDNRLAIVHPGEYENVKRKDRVHIFHMAVMDRAPDSMKEVRKVLNF